MIVVLFTTLAVGQETRRISARTSRRNCMVRVKNPVREPVIPSPRLAALPSAPSPAACGAGVPIGFSTEVSRAGVGSGKAPGISSS